MSETALKSLLASGVSVWLDDLTRNLIESGDLETMLETHGVSGVTTNPSIFSNAIVNDPLYKSDILKMRADGKNEEQIIEALTVADVQKACDVLFNVYEETAGADGYVSLEVEPALAHDAEATVMRATELWQQVGRPNVMIKIPATRAGVEAISQTISQGINVNVTLIFSVSRYREVISAYLYGLEKARNNGLNIATIRSVASIFISRFDSAVEAIAADSKQLQELSTQVGVANAHLIQEAFAEVKDTERYRFLKDLGAQNQRLLWASTGVKTKELAADFYAAELAVAGTINTLPAATLESLYTSNSLSMPRVSPALAPQTVHALVSEGVAYSTLCANLEHERLEKFNAAWKELSEAVSLLLV